jgi:hypothetical protein
VVAGELPCIASKDGGGFDRGDAFPFVRWIFGVRVPVGKPVEIGRSEFAVTPAPALDCDEAQSLEFAQRRSNSVTIDTELNEMLDRTWQSAVVAPCMAGELDLKASERTVGRQR